MDPFMAERSAVLAPDLLQILDIHAAMNDCVYLLRIVYLCVHEREATPTNMPNIGLSIFKCQARLKGASALVATGRDTLTKLPLRATMHTMQQWLLACAEFVKLSLDYGINASCSSLDSLAKKVDAQSPKWASCVSDESLNMEMATVMLLQSVSVPTLKDAVNNLWEAISALGKLGRLANLQSPVTEHPMTRDWVSLSFNSLKFGKDTIKVTAALKTIAEDRVGDVEVVLKHRASFPRALIEKLESMLQKRDGRENMHGPGMKRKASASSLMPSMKAEATDDCDDDLKPAAAAASSSSRPLAKVRSARKAPRRMAAHIKEDRD